MWRVGLHDLLHRRRRFALSVVATGLAFGLSLLMAGTVAHLQNETTRIVALFHADQFVVADGGTGPFTTTRLLPASTASLASAPGVQRADAFLQARDNLKNKDVNVLGIVPGGLGAPKVHHGTAVAHSGDVVIDEVLGYHVGDHVRMGGRDMRVVGTSVDTTYYFGQPTVFMLLHDAQQQFLDGQQFATAIAIRGHVTTAPPGTKLYDLAATRTDLNRPQASGVQTVQIINGLLWAMAAAIVATMVYLTALERGRDIAVLKSMGTANRTLFTDMAVQGLALAIAALAVGAIVNLLLTPVMPFAVETPGSAYVLVAAVAVVVGLLAALVGLRRAVHIDPALAFGRQA